MVLGLLAARLLLAPPCLAIAAWFVVWRRRRPDLVALWLTVKVAVMFGVLAVAAPASALGPNWLALACIGLLDLVTWAVALRLWIERRPLALSAEDAAKRARSLADEALDMSAVAERQRERGRDG